MSAASRAEASLADYVPLWRTIREFDLTILVTPSLDYVGAVELVPVDARFASEESIAGVGESLRSFVGATDADCTLQFLYRVGVDAADDIAQYEAAHSDAEGELARYVRSRAQWLRRQSLRKVRLFLFFSPPNSVAARVGLGTTPNRFAAPGRHADAAHQKRLKSLVALRSSLFIRLAQMGLRAVDISVSAAQSLYSELLNPSRRPASSRQAPLKVRANLWSPETILAEGEHLREYTEAEQLLVDDVEEFRAHLRFGGEREGVYRRALTLKTLPESGTSHLQVAPLLELRPADTASLISFPYWLCVVVHIQSQGPSRWLLDKKHGLVDVLQNAIPFLTGGSIARRTEDAAKQGGIAALFAELATMSSKLVSLSLTLLLDGRSLEELDARTQVAMSSISKLDNSELLREEHSQLPAFLSVLPGAGPYQLRKKTVTSRNAGDFLPVLAPWQGSRRPVSLLTSPQGDIFRFDPLDKSLAPAHHGLVIADTGSGKSMNLGALILDALAGGTDAILVDKGGSWEPLTRLFGGIHLPLDIRTPLTPFRPWPEMLDRKRREEGVEELDLDAIEDLVTFLELCVREEGERGFDKMATGLVARAVRRVYEGRFRAARDERPLMSDFRNELGLLARELHHPDDKRICESIHRGLGLYVGDEIYGRFLDRPSNLRFDARLLTFDMAGASKGRFTRSIAMATVMQAITTRAAAKRRPSLVAVDEGHSYLANDETSERFLATAYREMRKHGVAMWMLSQQFHDFAAAKSGPAIIGNSTLKLFLRHGSGHDKIAQFFNFTPRQLKAFADLEMRPGHFSDIFLNYGQRSATLRLSFHPLAYWVLTTDAVDKELLARAQAKNPHLPPLAVLEQVAQHYPHGAPK